ncbi:hypothetical protein L6164_030950 [Bauhinia variegata]|uniref:Uncharacterized protein n=1 Tax=Bauhinia variegata TaxID=167791 RepID=A0ACB9LEA4_BAUVA|nr:hypothetical protein L6164_030950 [Bauhinia variegata]
MASLRPVLFQVNLTVIFNSAIANPMVENVKALLEVETRVPILQQQLLFYGRQMGNSQKLSELGVNDEDLVTMVTSAASGNDMGLNPDGSAINPGAFQQHIRNDANLMGRLFQIDPELAQAVLGNDLNRLQEILRMRHQQGSELRRKRDEELAFLYADPFDVEAQRKIEAAIRQQGVDENWAAALEHNPEAFARVVCIISYSFILSIANVIVIFIFAMTLYVLHVMLYVGMEINGVPLKAFVDSGAQSTIISKSCAERCGLLRLLDQRYKGIAHGVGQSEILVIGNIFYPCSFLVLDSPNMEFLFGLDMLRKHQCSIDLKENVLRVGGGEVSVPFLQEKDIPSGFLGDERYSGQSSSSGAPVTSGTTDKNNNAPKGGQSSGGAGGGTAQGLEEKQLYKALKLFNGNEEQAAGFLFSG